MCSRWYTHLHAVSTDIYAVSLNDFHPGEQELGIMRLYKRRDSLLGVRVS